MVSIGIDPGKSTGVAVYDIGQQGFSLLTTKDFWSAYSYILVHYPAPSVRRLIVEVPDTKHVWHKNAGNLRSIQRQAVNVGGVIREAELLAQGFAEMGYNVIKANPRGKVTADKFKMITGWAGRTNQHERDAGLLCYGR